MLERAVAEAYDEGFLGKNILKSGYDLDVVLHRGAGAYICGEETALLSSLEGYRGQPRLRPPFPAVEGLYASPTAINNVETLCNVPHIMVNGAKWFAGIGTEKSPGTKIFSVSGKVNRPGNYEAPMGTPARVVIEEMAGGVLDGKRAEGVDAGRLLDAVPHRRSPRRGPGLRVDRRGRVAARDRRADGDRRARLHGRRVPAAARSSTLTSPAASARPAGRARGG